jgi:uncharacterized protein (DUF2267 family)
VVDFGTRLPLLPAGVYYDGWTVRDKPDRIKTQEEFVARVAEQIPLRMNPVEATLATL